MRWSARVRFEHPPVVVSKKSFGSEGPGGPTPMGAVMTAPEPHQVGELYDRYAHVIFLRARGILGSDEEAHDAVQETFAKVIKNWEQFRGESSPLTWMYRISTNLCLNRLRNKKGHERKHAAHPEEISGPATAWLR